MLVVPVNENYTPSAQEIKAYLDNTYKTAITYWDVSLSTTPLEVDFEDNQTEGLDTELPEVAALTKEMRKIKRAMKNRGDYDKDAYYIFLVKKSEKGDKNGIMPFRRHFGFVFMENSQQLKTNSQKLYRTIAHELAHGAFGLEHPWQSKGTTQGNTYNLLDYTTKTPNNLLRKYQWHVIHNPRLSLFGGDEEEEVSSKSDDFFFTWQTTDIKLDTAYHKDKLKILKKNDKVILRIYITNKEVDIKKTNWIYNDKTIVNNADTCSFPISEKGKYTINIKTDNDISLKLTINVYTEYRFVIGVDTLKTTDDYYHVTSNNLLKVKIFSLSGDTLKLDWYKDKANLSVYKNKEQVLVNINSIKGKDTYDIKLKAKISNDDEQVLNLKLYSPPIVTFEIDKSKYKGEFGFDNYFANYPLMKNNSYYDVLQINNVDYYVPYFQQVIKKPTVIIVKFKITDRMLKDKYFSLKTQTNSNNLIAKFNGTNTELNKINITKGWRNVKFEIELKDTISGITQIIDQAGNICGQINVNCKKPIVANLFLVYIKAGGVYNFNETKLLNKLNNLSYNQALVKWNIIKKDTIDVDSLYQAKYKAILNNTSINKDNRKRKLIQLVNYGFNLKYTRLDEKKYYLFITNIPAIEISANQHIAGFSPTSKSIAYMVVAPGYSKNDYYSDCTHELGHATGLEHTFKATPAGFGITKGSTNNYMDYVNSGVTDKRNYFWYKKQWEIIKKSVKSK